MTHVRERRWRGGMQGIRRRRILSVRSRIVLSILAVAGLGLRRQGSRLIWCSARVFFRQLMRSFCTRSQS